MTGGGGAQINFTFIFGRKNQKKVFILAVNLFSVHKSRLGKGARSLPGGARRNRMVQISLLPQDSGVKTKKKGLRREILGLVFAYTRLFRPGTKLYSRLGSISSNLGVHRPQNALQWHRACYLLSGYNPRLGGTRSLGRYKQ